MKKNDILVILVPLFIFVIAWVGFSIYHNIATSTISEPLSIQITPITPSFDTSVIDSLKTRTKIAPIYDVNTPIQDTISPSTPSASPTIITPTIPTPTPAQIQSSTSGGNLTK